MIPATILLQNRYQIIRKIGQGGMGAVYEAIDQRLGHTVAVKQIIEGDPQSFEREAQLLARLRHPALPKVTDHFVEAAGQFLVMDFIPGDDLVAAQARRRQFFTLTEVLDWADQLLAVLTYLHSHEPPVFHRDIKPANLKLTAEGRLVLLDFGLAKAQNAENADAPKSARRYTRHYASPEQMYGEQIDQRSDLYAVAATLYTLLTQTRPPDAQERTYALANGQPDPLRLAHLVNPLAPPALAEVLQRAMAIKPGERFDSAAVLRAMLNKIADVSETVMVEEQSVTAQAQASKPLSPNNLPAQLTSLVGRQSEIAQVQQLLQRADVRLVTLTGPGGVGKTRLGQQVATELLPFFRDGVFFVALAAIRDPNLAIATIAQTLGVREAGSDPLLESLQAYLRDKTLLLLIDNFEQVIEAAPRLTELLAACPQVKMLVTSRELLNLRGEHQFPVPVLPLPDLGQLPTLDTLAQVAAVELFVQRAQAVNPDFSLHATNAHTVADLCIRLDGLPLAIELAAARSKMLSPQAMLERINDRFGLLSKGARDLPDRQRTLRATLDWSYGLLTTNEKKLFGRLAVFVGGCTLIAAQQVCNPFNNEKLPSLEIDVLDGLASLLDKNLIYQQTGLDGDLRFMMLLTLHDYASARLSECSEFYAIHRLHAAYYLTLAEQAQSELSGPNQLIWLNRLETEHDNLRAVLHRNIENDTGEIALQLGGFLRRFWERYGHISEGRKWLKESLSRSSHKLSSLRASGLAAAGVLATDQGDYAAARSLIEEGLAIRRKLEDKNGVANSLGNLGNIARQQGDYADARNRYEECLRTFEELGETWSIATTLLNLGAIAHEQGDYSSAYSYYQKSLAIYKQLGDERSVAILLVNLGNMAAEQGDYTSGYQFLEQGLILYRKLGDLIGTSTALLNQGIVSAQMGNYSQAIILYQEALTLQEKVGERPGIAHSLLHWGIAILAQGDHNEAEALLRQSLQLLKELGNKSLIAMSLEAYAKLSLLEGTAKRSSQLLGAADALRKTIAVPLPPVDRLAYEQNLNKVRTLLGEKVFTVTWAVGQAMTMEQAIEYALKTVESK
ncbi:MAG: hypothetical protein DYG89_43585 [Caldilinea sp. CFX5]|nr:hypothetical protein [Caldilinea sp. CFX5]